MKNRAVLWALLLAGSSAQASDYSATQVTHADPRAQLAEQLKLYDTLCLKLFPNDAKLETELRNRSARAMTPDEVRLLLHDDPGAGWVLTGRTAVFKVTVEGPPFHACTVRTMTAAGYPDLQPYAHLRDRFEKGGAFSPTAQLDGTRQGVQTHLEAEHQLLPGGVTESLMMATVQVADPKSRAAGESNVDVRFVHQIVSPPDAPTS